MSQLRIVTTLSSIKAKTAYPASSIPVGVCRLAGHRWVDRSRRVKRDEVCKAGRGRQQQAQSVQVVAVHVAPRQSKGDRCSIKIRSARQSAWCEGPPMVNGGRGVAPDAFLLDPELRHHIQNCPCPCNHMGYGNVLDYQVGDSHSRWLFTHTYVQSYWLIICKN